MTGAERYPLTFSPFTIKTVTMRNRIVRTSMGSGMTVGGLVTDDVIAWHVARARGGVGLGFSDPGEVHWSSPAFLKNTSDQVVEGMRRLTDAVHAEGMQMFEQLMHGGATNIPQDGSSPWSASAVPDPGLGMVPRPMTRWMIDEVTAGFVDAARRAREGGMDGVEIHAGHGYLFSSFLSRATNYRTDEYGGSFDNRMRFLREVLAAVREGVGPDYVVGVRLSPDMAERQNDGDDVRDFAVELEAAGLVDFVDLSLGSHYGRDLLMGGVHERSGYQLAVTGDIARKLRLPTIVTGRMTSVAQVEAVLADRVADLVGMMRATIADPDLVRKTVEGREDEIRPCIACNQACAGGLNSRGRVTCTVNPAAGREIRFGDDSLRTGQPRRVVVVGGGPAGVEAARSAAVAGHDVVLLEAADELGGQLRLVRRSPYRSEVADLIPYYATALGKVGVDVRLGVTADLDAVRALAPDAVIVATGSRPRRDGFQTLHPWGPPDGFDSVEVFTSWDVLGQASLGHRVLLLDELGHYESLDVAERLTDSGHQVHWVTRFSAIAANLEMRWEMIGGPHARRLYAQDFRFYPRRVVRELQPGQARIVPIEAADRDELIEVDSFVFLSGNVAEAALYEQLRGAGIEARLVGDAVGPRLLEAATFEGQLAVRSLEPGWQRPAGLRFGQTGSAI